MLGRHQPRRYGDIDESHEVHDEIREVGEVVRRQVAAGRYAGGAGAQGVLDGLRQHGPAPGGQKLMDNELAAALWSIESGVYVTFRLDSASAKEDCCRVGPETLCFCGCKLSSHDLNSRRAKCTQCRCQSFAYIPTRPEEVGLGHLPRRKDFNIHSWSPKCTCGHGSKEHNGVTLKCKKCSCFRYQSDWACVACDKKYEDHFTAIESEAERRSEGRPVGEAYKPLAGLDPEFAGLVFGGNRPPAGSARAAHQSAIKRPSQQLRAKPSRPAVCAPAQSSVAACCASCGAAFTSPTAKFCPQCGTRR